MISNPRDEFCIFFLFLWPIGWELNHPCKIIMNYPLYATCNNLITLISNHMFPLMLLHAPT